MNKLFTERQKALLFLLGFGLLMLGAAHFHKQWVKSGCGVTPITNVVPADEAGKLVIVLDLDRRQISAIKNYSTFTVNEPVATGQFVFPRDSFKYEISLVSRPSAATSETVQNETDEALSADVAASGPFGRPQPVFITNMQLSSPQP